jgi:hypothetical protein
MMIYNLELLSVCAKLDINVLTEVAPFFLFVSDQGTLSKDQESSYYDNV